MVFSNVPGAEQGGEFIVKMIEIEDLQVSLLSKMKKQHEQNVEFGRWNIGEASYEEILGGSTGKTWGPEEG